MSAKKCSDKVAPSAATRTENHYHQTELPARMSRARQAVTHAPIVAVAIVVGLITFLVHSYHLSAAPDVFDDEGWYLQPALNMARGLGLMGEGHSTFLVQPPAYILIETAYIKLKGLTQTDPLTILFSVRYLNVFFSAATASLLTLFGRKLHSYGAGLVTAMLFIMDPYVQRINRRSMLETLAMLCALIGVYIFFTYRPHLTTPQRFGAGIAFGLAILAKEPMAIVLFALIVYVACLRRSQLRDVVSVTVTASAVCIPYPIWTLAVGQWSNFLSVQWDQFSRIPRAIWYLLPGSPAAPSTTSPTAHSLQNFLILLPQYATSYLLIVLAAIFTVVLIRKFGHREDARYVVMWYALSFVAGWALAMVSDQYFYYVIVPSALVCGYTVALLLEIALNPVLGATLPIVEPRQHARARTWIEYRRASKAILVVFLVMLLYNGYRWTANYAIGSDDAYINAIEYVTTHVPKGTTIIMENSGEAVFMPSYPVRFDRDPNVIMRRHERYFILTSKGVGYGTNTPQFYSWVLRNSRPLFEQYDRSEWTVGVYLLTTTEPQQRLANDLSHESWKPQRYSIPLPVE